MVGFGIILGLLGIGWVGLGSSVWVWMGCEVYFVDYAMDLDKTAPNPPVHPRAANQTHLRETRLDEKLVERKEANIMIFTKSKPHS